MARRPGSIAVLLTLTLGAAAQAPQPAAPLSAQDSFARLTPEEKQQFQAAGQDFNAQRFAPALAVYKTLIAAHPGDPLLAKMAGESAVDTDDTKLALTLLEPVEQQNPNDWQAAGILARAYNESGDAAHRDAEFAHMTALYNKGVTPKGLTQYICEKAAAGDKKVILYNSFVPWGNYKVQNYARVFDKDGKLLFRITLESSDIDQIGFAKEHPAEAAAGVRRYSLDGYRDGAANANGQPSQTQSLYGFLDGRPTYEEVRIYFLNIAAGKPPGTLTPNSLVVQPPPQPAPAH